eukprot:TRINITY_DN7822_c0_g2_i1.p1 TRINITY_DN7822_c0_g2~~TRINITY_DN7822_c0_g2_i1.p1  ORF type:complete len:713 (+),score=40.42 TRINITY_DN7822_c0_g2_i1:65-2203(+)
MRLRDTSFESLSRLIHSVTGLTEDGASVEGHLASAAHHDVNSAVQRMFFTLCVLNAAAMAGYAFVRMRIIQPKAGHTRAMAFFTDKIAFPLVLLRVVVTFDMFDVNHALVLSCQLAKLAGFVFLFVISYCFYKKDRQCGERIVTAAVFASIVTSTHDFAIGMPTLQALYGSKIPTQVDRGVHMNAYLVVNAAIQAVIFNPLISLIIHIGMALTKVNEFREEDEEEEESACTECLTYIKACLTNPNYVAFVFGIVFKYFLASHFDTMQTKAADAVLPHPLHDLVELITSAYVVFSLFLTGASYDAATFNSWATFIFAVKVLFCAILGRFILLAMGTQVERGHGYNIFVFFYGALPTSMTPMHFATEYDKSSVGIVSSVSLFTMMSVLPILYSSTAAVKSPDGYVAALHFVYKTVDALGLGCLGLIILAVAISVRSHWGFSCTFKQLMLCYIVYYVVYTSMGLSINPLLNETPCDVAYRNGYWGSPTVVVYAAFQCTCYLMALVIQYYAVYPPSSGNDSYRGFLTAGVCFLLAWLPAFAARPNAFAALCDHRDPSSPLMKGLKLAWMSFRLLAAVALSIMMIMSKGTDEDEEPKKKKKDRVLSDNTLRAQWTNTVPYSLIHAVVFVNTCCVALQFCIALAITCMHRRKGVHPTNSALTITMSEAILDHGQALVMSVALLMDDKFLAAVRQGFNDLIGKGVTEETSEDTSETDSD